MRESGHRLDAIASVPGPDLIAPLTTLICFSHLRWGFVYQRPQHLLTRAARHYRVFFVEEPVFDDVEAPRFDLTGEPGAVTVAVPVLPHGTDAAEADAMQRRLLDLLLAEQAGRRLICWYYTPMALGFSDHLHPDVCVYDCMDELSAFRFAPPALVERERELLERADIVLTGGQSLYEAKRGRHPNVHAFPSSIDAAHFGRARTANASQPGDQAGLPHPRLGYFGVIDERMDFGLLAEMADLRPPWQFVMIGPVVKIEEADLPRRPNIHWLGGKSYDELPDYLAGWDVGLMPFAMNESTRFISPTKTPEFLAAGVPVVSTPIVDVVRSYGHAGLVEIAAEAPAAITKVEALLARPKGAWLDRVDRRLASLSWDKTWDAMHALIRSALEGQAARRSPPAREAHREPAHV